MRTLLLILFTIFYTSSSLNLNFFDVSSAWNSFKQTKQRQFRSIKEEIVRKSIFEKNLQYIEKHNGRYNKGLETYKVGVTKFSDYTDDEIHPYTQDLQTPLSNSRSLIDIAVSTIVDKRAAADLPESFDWRSQQILVDIKDQGQCKSSWAFAVTSVLESHFKLRNGTLFTLSEQQLIDCIPWGKGCNGGNMDQAYNYIFKNDGLNLEEDYHYEAQKGKCRYNFCKPKVTIRAFARLTDYDEDDLKYLVYHRGPIAVEINASLKAFIHYKSGVYYDCDCKVWPRNHAVVIVGYGTDEVTGLDYWIVRNSWGKEWGQEGYGKVARNRQNHCGIASVATFPYM